MRYTSGFAAVAALVSLAAADDAPMADNTNIGITFAANLPGNGKVTGSFVGAGAPNGEGSNIQISLYGIPYGSTLSYGITANKITGNDCSTGGGLLNPYNGVTGSDCTENNQAECQIGDLSGKHGNALLSTGGANSFTANFVDDYLSTDKSSQSFFGNKALIIMDQTGTPLTCANLMNQQRVSTNAAKQNQTESASASASGMATMTSSSASQASESASASHSGNGAVRTAAAGLGAAAGMMAALLL